MTHSKHIDAVDSLCFNYSSFATNADVLSRAYSIRLLTKDARLSAMQQNVHAILRMCLGNYHLSKHSLKDHESFRKMELKAQGKLPDTRDSMDILDEEFIKYDKNRRCLVVTKVVQIERECDLSFNHYLLKVQIPCPSFKYYQVMTPELPFVGVLYSKMITKGIDLKFVLRLLFLINSSYEASFKVLIPESIDFTQSLNALVKEFIWEQMEMRGERVEYPSVSTMKCLAKMIFNEGLSAQLYTLRQGCGGYLYFHVIGKPCTVYEGKIARGMCYFKDSIKLVERCKLPMCPLIMLLRPNINLYYCIYTCRSSGEYNKRNVGDSKVHGKETAGSIIKTVMPLMNVPEGTILSTHLVFRKQSFNDLLNQREQRVGSKKMRNKGHESIPLSSSSSSSVMAVISDEQLCIFMTHFAKYLYSDANTDLFEQ